LESRFNKRDINADCLANAEDTLGLRIIDAPSNSKLRSIAHEVIAEQKIATSLAEEMRILYVATTRARDRLILTASQKHKTCGEMITNGFYCGPGPFPAWLLAGCACPLDWILYAFSDRKTLHRAFETGLAPETAVDELFSFNFHNQSELKELSQFVTSLKTKASKPRRDDRPQHKPGAKESRETRSDGETINNQLSIINQSLAWRYPFSRAPHLPAKSSVSEITHRNDEHAKFDYSKALTRRPACLMVDPGDSTKPIDPRLIGSAAHLLIAALDLTAPVTEQTIQNAKDKLLADAAVSASVAERIDTDAILSFFATDLGKLALDPANKVHREYPFTFALPASDWQSPSDKRQTTDDRKTSPNPKRRDNIQSDRRQTADDRKTSPKRKRRDNSQQPTSDLRYQTSDIRDTIIVQGIIDMLIQTPQGLIVIDFKTDKIPESQITARAELYRPQLDLYAKAAAEILNAKSTTKYLHFLTPRRAIALG